MVTAKTSSFLDVLKALVWVNAFRVELAGSREELLQPSLAVWPLRGEILKIGCRFAASQVVEVGRASGVETIAQISPEGGTSCTEILLPLRKVLWTILNFLAHRRCEVCGNLVHALGHRAGDVVE